MARTKGSKNKHSFQVEEIAAKFDKEPFEILMMFANGDWKGLGYESETRTSFAASGIEFEEPIIRAQDRLQATKEACKYLYSQKQAVQVSTASEGIKIIVEEYGNSNRAST